MVTFNTAVIFPLHSVDTVQAKGEPLQDANISIFSAYFL